MSGAVLPYLPHHTPEVFVTHCIIPIGGGNEIGASSYYIEFDGVRLLLDCGIRPGGPAFYPDYNFLLSTRLDAFWELDAVILSHAHYDHIGSLPYLTSQVDRLEILSSFQTRELTSLQLYTLGRKPGKKAAAGDFCFYRENQILRAVDMIQPLPFEKEIRYKNFSVTLFPAGHMPGAAMTLIQTANHKILYTGDFCDMDYPLTDGYRLPDGLNPDTVILCGTHAYRPYYAGELRLEDVLRGIHALFGRGINAAVPVRNISKGIEFATLMDKCMERGMLQECIITLDHKLSAIADAFEDMNYPVYSKNLRNSSASPGKGLPVLAVVSEPFTGPGFAGYDITDFSLHAGYEAVKQLIRKLKPRQTMIVHAEAGKRGGRNVITDLILRDGYQGDIFQGENGVIYEFE